MSYICRPPPPKRPTKATVAKPTYDGSMTTKLCHSSTVILARTSMQKHESTYSYAFNHCAFMARAEQQFSAYTATGQKQNSSLGGGGSTCYARQSWRYVSASVRDGASSPLRVRLPVEAGHELLVQVPFRQANLQTLQQPSEAVDRHRANKVQGPECVESGGGDGY